MAVQSRARGRPDSCDRITRLDRELHAGRRLLPAGGGDDGQYGSQGAVLLFVVAIIIAIHAIGGLDYRPSASELDMLQGLKSVGRGG